MSQLNKLYRNFIILQEDERGYSISNDKTLSGYSKIEAKGEKCKISFYAQNLRSDSDNYCVLAICGKKDTKQLVNFGKVTISDGGKVEVVKEYFLDDIGGIGLPFDKITGAAIAKMRNDTPVIVMCGFVNGEQTKDNWKNYKVVNASKDKPKEKIEFIKKDDKKRDKKDKEKSNSKNKEKDEDKMKHMNKEEKDNCDEDNMKHMNKEEKDNCDEKEDKMKHTNKEEKDNCDEDKMEHMNKEEKDNCDEDKMGHMNKEEKDNCDEDKMGHMNKEEKDNCDEDKMKHMNKEEKDNCDEDKMKHMNKKEKGNCNECEFKVKHMHEKEKKYCNEDEDNMKYMYEREDRENPFFVEDIYNTNPFGNYETNTRFSKQSNKFDNIYNANPFGDYETNTRFSKETNKFDDYESKIEELSGNFKIRGSVGEYFESIASGFEVLPNEYREIKNCKWYRVPVKDLDDLCNMTNYNRYTVAYYPMLNYYPYIRKNGYFNLGFKCDRDGNLKYIVYGIPGNRSLDDQPYEGKTGFVTWVNRENRNGMGCWLMFYDFRNSTVVVPME